MGWRVTGAPVDPHSLVSELGRLQVVDVRYPNEWEAGHIDGAMHIPLDYVLDRVGELDRSRPVVTVCRSGRRSAEAAKELAGEGFDVQNLEGGMEAWAAQDLPLVAADGGAGTVAEAQPPEDDRPEAIQRLQGEFLETIFAVQEHFGDRDPSEEEIQVFLRQRMIDQGKSPEEADRFLATMGDEPA